MVFYTKPETKTWGCLCEVQIVRQIKNITQAKLKWKTKTKTVEKMAWSKYPIPEKEGLFILCQEDNKINVVACCGNNSYFDFEGMRVFFGTPEKISDNSFGLVTKGMPETMHQFSGSATGRQCIIGKKISERKSKKGILISEYKEKIRHAIPPAPTAKKEVEDILLSVGAFAANPIHSSKLFSCDEDEKRRRMGWCSFIADVYEPLTNDERKQKEVIKQLISF